MKRRAAVAVAVVTASVLAGSSRPAEAFVRYLTDDNAPFFWAQATVPITGYSNDFTQTLHDHRPGRRGAAGRRRGLEQGDELLHLSGARAGAVDRADPAGGQRRTQLPHLSRHPVVSRRRQRRLQRRLRRLGAGGHHRHRQHQDRPDLRCRRGGQPRRLPVGRPGGDPQPDQRHGSAERAHARARTPHRARPHLLRRVFLRDRGAAARQRGPGAPRLRDRLGRRSGDDHVSVRPAGRHPEADPGPRRRRRRLHHLRRQRSSPAPPAPAADAAAARRRGVRAASARR